MSKIIVKSPPLQAKWCYKCLDTHLPLPGECKGRKEWCRDCFRMQPADGHTCDPAPRRRWCADCYQMQDEAGHECKGTTRPAIPLPAPGALAPTYEDWINQPDADEEPEVPEYVTRMLEGMMRQGERPKPKEEAKSGEDSRASTDHGEDPSINNPRGHLYL